MRHDALPLAGPERAEWRFFAAWALPVLLLLHAWRAPQSVVWGTLALWALVALIDAGWPSADRSPPAVRANAWHHRVLRGYVPLQLLLQLGVGALVVQRELDATTGALLGISVGWVAGSIGITYAHELGHSRHASDRRLAWLLMGSVLYSHFMVEHYRGHHARAATHADPASARRGESLYRFLPRTLWGSWVSAWRIETGRWRDKGETAWRSPLLGWHLVSLLALGFMAAQAAWALLAFVAAQAAVAVLLLETINYIEHYGLRRQVQASGQTERFGPMHAWNADHAASNALLVNLQRHADHHMHAWKPFAELQPLPDAPQLPTGYAGCLALALVPPLWFALMHPRLDALSTRAA